MQIKNFILTNKLKENQLYFTCNGYWENNTSKLQNTKVENDTRKKEMKHKYDLKSILI